MNPLDVILGPQPFRASNPLALILDLANALPAGDPLSGLRQSQQFGPPGLFQPTPGRSADAVAPMFQDAANRTNPVFGGLFPQGQSASANPWALIQARLSQGTQATTPQQQQSSTQAQTQQGDPAPHGAPAGSPDLAAVQAALNALGASQVRAGELDPQRQALVKLAASAKQHGGNLTSKLATGEYIPPELVIDLITHGGYHSGKHTARPIDETTALSNIYQNLQLAQAGGPHVLGTGALEAQAGPMTLADKQAGQAAMDAATPAELDRVWAGVQAAAAKNGITLQDADRQVGLLHAYQQHAQFVRIGVATP